jgi:ferredoxin/menaquinone-dependent protoporphyrinogen IX oxidase
VKGERIMVIKKFKILYFSPTGTTKKIVETIASSIQCEKLEAIDFTKKKVRENADADFNVDLVIIGSPVYYGRIPNEVTDYLLKIHVDNVYAILVVAYGNREYEDSLKELYDTTCAAGFIPIACAAFIGEHSYSSEKLPMAHGRPDEIDLEKAKLFGATIQKELDFLVTHDNTNKMAIPGSRDYKNKTMPKYPLTPNLLIEHCTVCKRCMEVCPVEAISIDEQSNLKTDINLCILCFGCVKNCPSHARRIDDPLWSQAMELLQKKCLERKEPEVYLGRQHHIQK